MKQETYIGQTVYKIGVNILEDKYKPSIYKEGVIIEELKIIYQTDLKIALSDEYITILSKDNGNKSEYNTYIGELCIIVETDHKYWSNGLFCKIYTLDNSGEMIDSILSDIAKTVKTKYSFLFNGLFEKLNNLKIEIL